MKKTILSAVTILLVFVAFGISSPKENTVITKNTTESVTLTVSDYNEGWKDGYCEGWKDVKGQMAMCPMAPMAPMAEMGKDTYRGGYNRGFKAGRRAAMR